MGTSMGSREEFNEMIRFIEKYKIKPIIDKVYSLEEAIQALSRMEQENSSVISLYVWNKNMI